MTAPSPVKTVLIAKETTWGTYVVPTKDVGLVQDFSDEIVREVIQSKGMGAIATQKINSGILESNVSMSVEFQHGRLLEFAFGTVGHGDTSDDTTHTFTINNSPPSMSIHSAEDLTSDVALNHTGMVLESLDLNCALNETLKMDVELKGQVPYSQNSTSTAVLSSLSVFPHSMVHVLLNQAEATEVQNFSMKMTKVVEKSGGMGSLVNQQAHATSLEFEFAGSLGFTDRSFQGIFLGSPTSTASVTAVATASTTAGPLGINVTLWAHNNVTLGSGRREVKITLDNCQFSTFTKTASIGSLTFMDIAGFGTLNEAFSVDNIASASW